MSIESGISLRKRRTNASTTLRNNKFHPKFFVFCSTKTDQRLEKYKNKGKVSSVNRFIYWILCNFATDMSVSYGEMYHNYIW